MHGLPERPIADSYAEGGDSALPRLAGRGRA
jgi:hypothetical protein